MSDVGETPSTTAAPVDGPDIVAAVLFVGWGIAGFSVWCALRSPAAGALGCIAAAQAVGVLLLWPARARRADYAAAPLALILYSAPVYTAGIMWSSARAVEVWLSLLVVYMLFLYVTFLMRLEVWGGAPAAAWYVPVSALLVGGPVLIHYVCAEFLRRQVGWMAGISPLVALMSPRHLTAGCGALVIVLAALAVYSMLTGERTVKG